MLPDSKVIKLKSSNQEASPGAGKNNRIVLVPCRSGKYALIGIFGVVDIPVGPGCYLLL